MAAVVECMRDWRAKHRRSAVTLPALPAELTAIVQNTAAQLWTIAQKHAADNVAAQQAALRAERAEMLELSAQQSMAFEIQTTKLERLQEELITLKASLFAVKQELEAERKAAKQAANETAFHQKAAVAKHNEQLAQTNEALTVAREETAQLRGELMGMCDAYSQLLASVPAKAAEKTKSKPIKAPKTVASTRIKKPKS